MDHIHTLQEIICKTNEYEVSLVVCFVDYAQVFDSVSMSSTLKTLKNQGIDVGYILYFADDIFLFATKAEELTKRLQELNSVGQKTGPRINMTKTKVMYISFVGPEPVNLQDVQIEACSRYTYLGQLLTTGEKNWINEVNRRIKPG